MKIIVTWPRASLPWFHLNGSSGSHKTTAVGPLTSHLTIYPCKTSKRCGALMEKQGRTYK